MKSKIIVFLAHTDRIEVSTVLAMRAPVTNLKELKKSLQLELNSEQINQKPEKYNPDFIAKQPSTILILLNQGCPVS